VSIAARIANRVYRASALPSALRFARALENPAAAQRRVLERILRENAESEFGKRHGFGDVADARAFRDRVPVSEFDTIAGDVERIVRGDKGVLTSHDVFCLEPTTGSAGASKLMPYTRPLLREFSAATMPWIADLLRQRPALRNGRAYWAVSPPARSAPRSDAVIPVGLEHDSDYFPPFARALLDRVLGTPRALSRVPDIEAWRYLTLRALLALPDLAFISVWNPSFLTLLADALDGLWERLLHDMKVGDLSVTIDSDLRGDLARALPARPDLAITLRRRFGARPPEDLGIVWNRLALISCWTDGHAQRAVVGMTRRFPRVEVQSKGLLATEGVVSFPMIEAGGSVAAVASHYLEFVAEGGQHAEACGVEDLTTGASYEVLLTTSGGLYRYRLKDLVRVTGWHRNTPTLTFAGRADRSSDLVGEKLSPRYVERVLEQAAAATGVKPSFAMLAPVWGLTPRYHLFVQGAADAAERLARDVETRLMETHHYALCRRLGQLGAVRAAPVLDADRTYERVCVARGQRAGAIKPASLDPHFGWENEFTMEDRAAAGAA
jgi:hypothetical protein